ncbi:GNAT family N-acetyltransferase (plasmid) [Halarchaeum sp. CBA1220]|uniref:GNAT family N-acetyltransferase n=1 Tax=Halarchaeum sp. CBA1220 TaxID=1853682 RepID=UPI000F3A98B4|nr:GNAT family N-acetyltransferase [Halarchaeum sp. CBA1220]QLC35207.1 GNAT family N-acetyltransferase [Halarchaeum sp. CBA1220]
MSSSPPETNIRNCSSTSSSGSEFVTTVDDERGRSLDITGYHGHLSADVVDDLTGMYVTFGYADRAQGLPPLGGDAVRSWLERLGDLGAYHVVVRHDGTPAAHAVLVPDSERDDGTCELAIFVQPDYQGARVGTRTMRVLFAFGRERGVDTVWLHVEKSNAPAVALYERYDFEVVDEHPLEFEMRRELD